MEFEILIHETPDCAWCSFPWMGQLVFAKTSQELEELLDDVVPWFNGRVERVKGPSSMDYTYNYVDEV